MNRHPFWYSFTFLILEFFQAIVGIITFTLFRPNVTLRFARWYSGHYIRRMRKATFND